MGAAESVNATRRVTSGVLVGFITFTPLRWIAGMLREALGMGDVLLFAALGGWVGAVVAAMLL